MTRRLRASRAGQLAAEAVKMGLSHLGPAILAMVVVAAMTAALLLTNGRVAGAQRDLLQSFDRAGGRVITVQPGESNPLNSRLIGRLKLLDDVEWAGAFGIAEDLHNRAVPGGEAVPVRRFATTDFGRVGINWPNAVPDATFASSTALQTVGMNNNTGGLVGEAGASASVVGELVTPGFLRSMEPLALQPSQEGFDCSVIVIVASDMAVVDALAATLAGLFGTEVRVSTSSDLIAMRQQVQTQLGVLGNGLVLGALIASTILVSAIQLVLVLVNRKDYGRRRALGARRSLIMQLVATKSAIEGAVGSLAGVLVASAVMLASGNPLPDFWFQLSVVMLATSTSLLGALFPAWFASRRDPLVELRVP